jgi:hypothetical protein
VSELIHLIVWIAVLAIVAVAVWWILSQVPLPDPIRKIVIIAVVAIVAVLAIILLLQVGGGGLGIHLSP